MADQKVIPEAAFTIVFTENNPVQYAAVPGAQHACGLHAMPRRLTALCSAAVRSPLPVWIMAGGFIALGTARPTNEKLDNTDVQW